MFLHIATTLLDVDVVGSGLHAAGALVVHMNVANPWRNMDVCQEVIEKEESSGAEAPLASNRCHHGPTWGVSHVSVRTLTYVCIRTDG